jgi:3-deoxy-D-manno-octulosonate 8-phosphate phosphatase (KDO 8-P phosphatase)
MDNETLSRIKLLLMDCDGVLTDGRIWLLEDGTEQKSFSVRDGLGLELWHRAGLSSGIISGRSSAAVERRARELKVRFLRQGNPEKVSALDEIISEAGLTHSEVAFIGDDVNDIPLMELCGLGIAVADASDDTRAIADYVTRAKGGRGAIREAVELILKSKDLWPLKIQA